MCCPCSSVYITNCQWLFSPVGRTHTKKNLRRSKTSEMLGRYGNNTDHWLGHNKPTAIHWLVHWYMLDCFSSINVMIPNERLVSCLKLVSLLKSVCFRLLVRFGEESMSRVLRWMDNAKIPENAAILDIGTGNGAFLVELVWVMKLCIIMLCRDLMPFTSVVLKPF